LYEVYSVSAIRAASSAWDNVKDFTPGSADNI